MPNKYVPQTWRHRALGPPQVGSNSEVPTVSSADLDEDLGCWDDRILTQGSKTVRSLNIGDSSSLFLWRCHAVRNPTESESVCGDVYCVAGHVGFVNLAFKCCLCRSKFRLKIQRDVSI